jgi:UDP-N-acetylmuramyl pentapeptide phosphotransferase/UDP-N-acetylglucosamine-1-phosphate transferase
VPPAVVAALVAPGDRWLLAFVLATVVVLVGGAEVRRIARRRGGRDRNQEPEVRGLRRRGGALLAAGPLVGLLVAPAAGDRAALAAIGALALGIFGAATERRRDFTRQVWWVALGAAVVAAVAGVRFGPTGVDGLDALLGVAFVWLVVVAFDGLGNADGIVPTVGVFSGLGVLALAAFGDHLGPANVAAGLTGACLAFLAFNLRPASIFAGRGGRLAVGFALGVTALSVEPTAGAAGKLVVPVLLCGVALFDFAFVAVDRLRRRRRLSVDRRDHLVHRFMARDASVNEVVLLFAGVQALLSALAVFAGRGVLPVVIAAAIAVIVLGIVGGAALAAPLERMRPVGFSARAVGFTSLIVVVVGLAVVPAALAVPGVATTMQDGRREAERGLAAARNGNTVEAAFAFRRAAVHFDDAADRMHGMLVQPARYVPGLAPNVRAARALAEVGRDLAEAGESVASTVVPENLSVVDGRVDLAEVRRVTPSLEQAAGALEGALAKVDEILAEPYLLPPVRDAAKEVRAQLARSAGEARNTATAAKLAPAILGAGGPRRYLLVVQNNAEARATGGLIGSYGVLTADGGDVDVSRLQRTGVWNATVARAGDVTLEAPDDYVRRYGQFRPERNLQNVNLSPDFPTVAGVLTSLTDAAGVGPVDGVLSVDPKGLAALLALTGPVDVAGWPTPITADNVVDVTLRDAYAEFAKTPERADFLGDVADVVVDEATTGELGKPARVAAVLGAAAHEGHLSLAFTRPEEQRLARRLEAAGAAPRGGAHDLLHVTTSNVSANKLDYYLRRNLDYRVTLTPGDRGEPARADGQVLVNLANTAPKDGAGLPRTVAGPWEGQPGRFKAGQLLSLVSVYTPLDLVSAAIDGAPTGASQVEELGTHVITSYVDLEAGQARTLDLRLEGEVPVSEGGWYTLDLGHQPTLQPDRVRVSVSVPEGWRIDAVRGGLARIHDGRAARILSVDRPRTLRVHVVPQAANLWERLQAGA